jgi:hypothetical protein
MNQESVCIPAKVLEIMREGRLSPFALGVYVLLQLQADQKSVWTGSADQLQECFPAYDESVLESYIKHLEKVQLIRFLRQSDDCEDDYSILILR